MLSLWIVENIKGAVGTPPSINFWTQIGFWRHIGLVHFIVRPKNLKFNQSDHTKINIFVCVFDYRIQDEKWKKFLISCPKINFLVS